MCRAAAFWITAGFCVCISCSEYTPKPRGYFRIEPPAPAYVSLPPIGLPYSFQLSSLATVQLPPFAHDEGWLNLSYPSLGATIYCSYLPVNPSTLEAAIRESRELVSRQAKQATAIREQAYSNPQERVYATLYELDGASASPLQFTLTDSATHFFRGALYYQATPNPDSLAPVTQYLKADVIAFIQSFNWTK
jgi:gliding motility-associated lipoprotein GldD